MEAPRLRLVSTKLAPPVEMARWLLELRSIAYSEEVHAPAFHALAAWRRGVSIEPALVLAVIVGLFHVSAYVFIRGRAGARLPLLILAAVLGAWAGDTVGARMNIDPLRIGDFHLISASIVAWLGIGLVAILAVLVPERRTDAGRPRVSTTLKRASAPATPSEPEAEAPAS